MKQHRFAYGWMMYLAACGGGGAALGEGVSGGREFPDSGLGVDSAGETGGETGATAETSVAVETAGLDTAGDDTGTPAETGGSETAVLLPDYVDISASDMTIVGDMYPPRPGMQEVHGAGDLDGDGRNDLIWWNMPPYYTRAEELGLDPAQQFGVVLDLAPGVRVQSGADGLWNTSVAQGFSPGSGAVTPLGDFDGDGFDDVFVEGVDGQPTGWILPGPATGEGLLADIALATLLLTDDVLDPPSPGDFSFWWEANAGMGELGVVEDLNGDGRPGLFIQGAGELALIDGLPVSPTRLGAVRWASLDIPSDRCGSCSDSDYRGLPAFGEDWNGDGATDFTVALYSRSLAEAPAELREMLAITVQGPLAPGSTTPVLDDPFGVVDVSFGDGHEGDINDDGLPELLWTTTDLPGGAAIEVYEMSQPLSLGESEPLARVEDSLRAAVGIYFNDGNIRRAVSPVGDFDGDSHQDLAFMVKFDNPAACPHFSGVSGCWYAAIVYGPIRSVTDLREAVFFSSSLGRELPASLAVLGDTNADGLTDLAFTRDTLTTEHICGGWYYSTDCYTQVLFEGSELSVIFGRSDRFE